MNQYHSSATLQVITEPEAKVVRAEDLTVKIFADGADREALLELYQDQRIRGFTTNPTLMKRAGISDYEAFARSVLSSIRDRPISFEVFSDDLDEMYRQALKIASWGDNVNVKIPITNTGGHSTAPLVRALSKEGVTVNVTAITTIRQVDIAVDALAGGAGGFVSVFAGRIADTGRDPLPTMKSALELMHSFPKIELIWASPREVFNIVQANGIGCHIITVVPGLLSKLPTFGRGLEEFSLETVKMFHRDAQTAGFTL